MTKTDKKCTFCGKRPRGRCLSSDRPICSRCCGMKRGSEIACAEDCRYYPFSIEGYDLWLRTDSSLARKMFGYLKEHYEQDEFEDALSRMSFEEEPSEAGSFMAIGSAVYYLLFVQEYRHGRTLAEQWKEEGWHGLNNDERVMMECRTRGCHATVIEIQKVLDHQAIECIDLLDPDRGTFILVDRSTAKQATRFARIITWLAHYPHFSRAANDGVELTDMAFEGFMEVLESFFRKERRVRRSLTKKRFFSENYGELCQVSREIHLGNLRSMLRNMDVHHCRALYALEGAFEDVEAVLDKYPEFIDRERFPEEEHSPGARYYSWLRSGGSKELERDMPEIFQHEDESEGVGSLGTVALYPDRLIIETVSRLKYDFAKKKIKEYLGDSIVFRGDMVVDKAKQMAEGIGREREEDRPERASGKDIPPEVERQVMQDYFRSFYGKFLEDKVPALDGRSPREAAKDPAMRGRLIELMKEHVRSIERQNRAKNVGLDIDWVLEELGLTELL